MIFPAYASCTLPAIPTDINEYIKSIETDMIEPAKPMLTLHMCHRTLKMRTWTHFYVQSSLHMLIPATVKFCIFHAFN